MPLREKYFCFIPAAYCPAPDEQRSLSKCLWNERANDHGKNQERTAQGLILSSLCTGSCSLETSFQQTFECTKLSFKADPVWFLHEETRHTWDQFKKHQPHLIPSSYHNCCLEKASMGLLADCQSMTMKGQVYWLNAPCKLESRHCGWGPFTFATVQVLRIEADFFLPTARIQVSLPNHTPAFRRGWCNEAFATGLPQFPALPSHWPAPPDTGHGASRSHCEPGLLMSWFSDRLSKGRVVMTHAAMWPSARDIQSPACSLGAEGRPGIHGRETLNFPSRVQTSLLGGLKPPGPKVAWAVLDVGWRSHTSRKEKRKGNWWGNSLSGKGHPPTLQIHLIWWKERALSLPGTGKQCRSGLGSYGQLGDFRPGHWGLPVCVVIDRDGPPAIKWYLVSASRIPEKHFSSSHQRTGCPVLVPTLTHPKSTN